MTITETTLTEGHRYATKTLTRIVEGKTITVGTSAHHDLVSGGKSSQAQVMVDDAIALSKVLRVTGETCEAVITFGDALGGGTLKLHWRLADAGDAMSAEATGEWNGAALAPVALRIPKDGDRDTPSCDGLKDMPTLTLADGGAVEGGMADEATAKALASFAKEIEVPKRDRSSLCVAGCTAAAAACAIACAGGALTPAAPVTPLCAAGCVALESACMAACV